MAPYCDVTDRGKQSSMSVSQLSRREEGVSDSEGLIHHCVWEVDDGIFIPNWTYIRKQSDATQPASEAQ